MSTEDVQPYVSYREEDAIAILTLNRPARRNPITDPGMIDGLLAALARVNADRGVRAVVLTGAGSAFSAGGNVRRMAADLDERARSPVRTPAYYIEGIQRVPLAFQQLEVPVIAAVNGPAIGAGCDLTCMCDLRIASDRASFAESFVKLGLVAGDGGAWLLQRAIGPARACEMAFTGDAIDAATALAIGLVSQVVPADDLLPAALRLAGRIAANPPDAVRMTKRLMLQAREQTLPAALESARALQALAQTTPEHRTAVMAFMSR
ncbi:crotonase/enoyl-CoA hydratase family protein [Verticiella sediminum]|uniref:Crotonase/enoyl-CoA hydratase family protein n=1 Tax=Verticiella sediminum TaxID=1247510 RepID=A0A556AGM1_9BURK|nr:crotonase/enoyl-CoA hydratase family protein [Verticiella sediminum]TSH92037.1 crotonase/enoyl-CoA hydratase family protein [Verticiella sediminum]